jgi:hypothetical protein
MAVTLEGGDELSRRLHAIDDPHKLLGKLQLDTVAEAKRLVPRKTGTLGRSIMPGIFTGSSALVHARAGYAAYVEKGTRPHVIKPRNARSLRFPAPGVSTTLGGRARSGEVRRLGAGAFVFAGKVNHPGTKPQPFLLPGAKKAVARGGLKGVVVKLWNEAA